RPDAALVQSAQNLAVTFQRRLVPNPRLRLDAAPLHRDPQGIDSHFLGQVEIEFRVAPPVAGAPAAVAGLDPSGRFPCRPLIVVVVAFHLVGRGRNAPEETAWKDEIAVAGRRLHVREFTAYRRDSHVREPGKAPARRHFHPTFTSP